jgi:hypothetical protein
MAIRNIHEGYCYVCGGVVPEEQGIAEQLPRNPGDAGWGKTDWKVRHKECDPKAPDEVERQEQGEE